jgi:putative salt-induced outer membrane protein
VKKIISLSLVVTSVLFAADAKKVDNSLKTHAELGFIDTKGNTNTQTYNYEADFKKSIEVHSFELKFDGQYAENNKEENKNKHAILFNYDYAFNPSISFNYVAGYKNDKFSGFAYQWFTGPGVKWNAYKSDRQSLSMDASVLYSYDKYDDGIIVDNEDYNDYAAGRATLAYELQVLENLKFTQDLSYRVDLSDADTYFVYSKSALSSKISDIFSAGISYKVDYVNQPPAGVEHTDRTLTANLILDY